MVGNLLTKKQKYISHLSLENYNTYNSSKRQKLNHIEAYRLPQKEVLQKLILEFFGNNSLCRNKKNFPS